MKRKIIRVLICDDSALVRVSLKGIIESDPEIDVIDVARNGRDAIDKAEKLKPDVIVMDIEMPVMNGIEALKIMVKKRIAPVIMFSSLTKEGADKTMEAIEIGAFDCHGKPGGSRSINRDSKEIIEKIKKAADSDIYKKIFKTERTAVRYISPRVREPLKKSKSEGQVSAVRGRYIPSGLNFKAVALGISTGGPKSIFHVLPKLPEDLNAAIFVVQHMPKAFITAYAKRINSRTSMKCVESEAGMKVEKGTIYVAQGDLHLKLMKKFNGDVVIRQSAEPDHLFTPSVDIMMDSVADVFKGDTVGVLMTGMGWDGAKGMVKICGLGGDTIAESEKSAIVFGMPHEAIKRGGALKVVPNWEIAEEIEKSVKNRSK